MSFSCRLAFVALLVFVSPLHGGEKNDVASLAGRWSFTPVRTPETGESVDFWIDKALAEKNVAALPAATSVQLLRRQCFALTGLPPQVDDFAQLSQAADPGKWLAEQRERLMQSPQFGEHWARHWMDVVRFAESKGHEYDYEIQGAWRYRDYLIRAFTQDLPYAEFLREHLMGDFMQPFRKDPATGENESELASIWWNLAESSASPTDLPNDEGDRLDNPIDVLGKSFQALTFGCARCHDHKLDPISQRDYYALFGVLAHTPMQRRWAPLAGLSKAAEELRKVRDSLPQEEGTEVDYQLEKNHQLMADFGKDLPAGWSAGGFWEFADGFWTGRLAKRLPGSLRSPYFTISSDYVDVLCCGQDSQMLVSIANLTVIRDPIYQGLRKPLDHGWKWKRFEVGRWKGQRAYVEAFTGKEESPIKMRSTDSMFFAVRAVVASDGAAPVFQERKAKADPATSPALEKLRQQVPLAEPYLSVAEPLNGYDTPVFFRGDASKPKELAARGYLTALKAVAGHAPIQAGSGRRELAEALLAKDNPLTARVWVNRVWHWLFGRGLVATPDDFGKLGDPPTHPELLDMLAWKFTHVHAGSTRALIREIMASAAWQRASSLASPEADAENKLLSHFFLLRLPAESIRDSLLAAAGQLDSTVGGPSVSARPRAQFFTNVIDWKEEGTVDGEGRRSLYLRSRRNYPDAFLALFDKPAPVTSFGKRNHSQTPAQALALLNDPLPNAMAEAWAEKLVTTGKTGKTVEENLAAMVLQTLGRPATAADIAAAKEMLGTQSPAVDAYARYALALFNLKEFIHVE